MLKPARSRSLLEFARKLSESCRSATHSGVDEANLQPHENTTVQYLLLIYANEAAAAQTPPEERQKSFGEWMSYTANLKSTKAFVAGDALQPTATATSVRIRNGER